MKKTVKEYLADANKAVRLQETGPQKVAHIAGRFNSRKEKGGPVEKIKGIEEFPVL